MNQSSHRLRILLQSHSATALFVLALIVRCSSFVFLSWWFSNPLHWGLGIARTYPVLAGDSSEYLTLAQRLLSDGVYTLSTHAPFILESFRLPGYPWLLAICLKIGIGVTGAMIVQMILSSATVAVVYLLARRWFSKTIAISAALLLIFEPSSIFFSTVISSDTLFVFLVVTGMYVALLPAQTRSRATVQGMAAGFLLGYATLVRVIGEFIPFVLVLYLWSETGFSLRVPDFKKDTPRIASVIALVIVFVLTIAPWAYRNHELFGTYTLSSTSDINFVSYTIPMFYAETHHVSLADATAKFAAGIPANEDYLEQRSLEHHAYFTSVIHQQLLPNLPSYTVFHVIKTIPFFITDGLRDLNRTLNFVPIEADGTQPNFSNDLLHGNIHALLFDFERSPPDQWLLYAGASFWLLVVLLDIIAVVSVLVVRSRHTLPLLFCALLTLYFGILTGPVSQERYRMPATPFMFIGAVYGAMVCVSLVRWWIAKSKVRF